ncbi:MAG: hypothetical protein ABI239_02835 [Aquihabitans sp.]
MDTGDAVLSNALLKLANSLDASTASLVRAATELRGEWDGPHRSRFDAEQARRNAHTAALIADCRRLAVR